IGDERGSARPHLRAGPARRRHAPAALRDPDQDAAARERVRRAATSGRAHRPVARRAGSRGGRRDPRARDHPPETPQPMKLAFLMMIAPVAVVFLMGRIGAWMPLLAFTGSMALLLTFSRRFERTADRGAIALGGDPEALISGLVKLSRLNHVPIAWG